MKKQRKLRKKYKLKIKHYKLFQAAYIAELKLWQLQHLGYCVRKVSLRLFEVQLKHLQLLLREEMMRLLGDWLVAGFQATQVALSAPDI